MTETLVPRGTMRGHTGRVTAIAAPVDNPDIILSSSSDKSIIIWKLTKDRPLDDAGPAASSYGVPLRRLNGHSRIVQDVAVSRDAKHAVSASWDGDVRIWDLESGATFRRLVGHAGPVLSVAINGEILEIVSASVDGTIKVWDTFGVCRYTIQVRGPHANWATGVRFVPNAVRPTILSGSWDGAVKVWNLSPREACCTLTVTGDDRSVSSVAVSPDGFLCASGGFNGKIQLWSLGAGEHLLLLHCFDAWNGVRALCFSPARYWLCASTGYRVKIWDLDSKFLIQEIKNEPEISKVQNLGCTSLCWSCDGDTLFTGCSDGTIWAWEIESWVPSPLHLSDGVTQTCAAAYYFLG